MEFQKVKNLEVCGCTYPCDKKGLCCECLVCHNIKNELPNFYFKQEKEATCYRTIEN